MSKDQNQKYFARRVELGEVVGGGYFVFRRGATRGRLITNHKTDTQKQTAIVFPFEHPNERAAKAEAERLSRQYPHSTFSILKQVHQIDALEPLSRTSDEDREKS